MASHVHVCPGCGDDTACDCDDPSWEPDEEDQWFRCGEC